MKFIKENFWNKLVKGAAIEQQRKMYNHNKGLIEKSEAYLKRLTDCQSLLGLLEIHKELWIDGYRNKNLGPDPYGMFRTNYIPNMTPDEVYPLGNIFGLRAFSLSKWEEDHKTLFGENMYGIPADTTNYEVVLNQYRELLVTNVINLVSFSEKYISEYHKFIE